MSLLLTLLGCTPIALTPNDSGSPEDTGFPVPAMSLQSYSRLARIPDDDGNYASVFTLGDEFVNDEGYALSLQTLRVSPASLSLFSSELLEMTQIAGRGDLLNVTDPSTQDLQILDAYGSLSAPVSVYESYSIDFDDQNGCGIEVTGAWEKSGTSGAIDICVEDNFSVESPFWLFEGGSMEFHPVDSSHHGGQLGFAAEVHYDGETTLWQDAAAPDVSVEWNGLMRNVDFEASEAQIAEQVVDNLKNGAVSLLLLEQIFP